MKEGINIKKIRFISFLLVIIQIILFCPINFIFPNKVLANQDKSFSELEKEYPGTLTYDSNSGDLIIKDYSRLGSASYTRFATIGYTFRLYNSKTRKRYATQVYMSYDDSDTNPKSYGFHKTEVFNKDGYEFSTFKMSLKTLEQIFVEDFGEDFSPITGFEDITLTYDSIISIKEPNASLPNARMNSNREIIGSEYYRTANGDLGFDESRYIKSHKISSWKTSYDTSKNGIMGARSWIAATKNDFPYKFNQSLFIPSSQKPKVDKPVKVICKDVSGNVLYEDIVAVYQIDGSGTVHSQTAPRIPGYECIESNLDFGDGFNSPEEFGHRFFYVLATNSKHDVCFTYKKKEYVDEVVDGTIKFSPHTSDWLNSPYMIKVDVEGNTTIKKYGYENRSYSYTNYSGQQVTKTISFPFCETWIIDKIEVQGIGLDLSANKSYTFNTTIANGSSFVLNTNAQNIAFSGKLTNWISTNKTYIAGSPPKGSWNSDIVASSTNKPSENYASNSKIYRMDQIAPNVSISSTSSKWRNTNMEITISAEDNLSGLQPSYKNFDVVDNSHYKHSLSWDLIYQGISNNKHLYNKTIVLKEDGIFNINGKILDNANNATDFTYGLYHIDKTNPYNPEFNPRKRQYLDDELIVDVSVGDNLSGVAKVEYCVTRSETYNGEKKTLVNITTPENAPTTRSSFPVEINQNGKWFIHTWIYDRAGNVTETRSNVGYAYFKINPDENIKISPTSNQNNVLRGSRFDIITTIDMFTKKDADSSYLLYTMPRWVDDDVDKKINGVYTITPGHGAREMANIYNNLRNRSVDLWYGFIPPYGTPLTKDTNGNIIGEEYTVIIELTYISAGDGAKKTKPITKTFSVIPEQTIKPLITSNEK